MKRFLLAVVLCASVWPVFAADVGVSVSIGQPGFYGQIDIGNFPRPVLYSPRPVVVEHVIVSNAPVYLRVPPGHRKHWAKHCHEYGACGRQVYFVQDSWYTNVYVPQYRERHRDWDDEDDDDHHEHHYRKGHDEGHGHRHHDHDD